MIRLAILPLLLATGCAGLQTGGVDFSCVLDDDRLGAPFRDPERARKWLEDTIAYLRDANARIKAGTWRPTAEDLARLRDLADLAARARKCIG